MRIENIFPETNPGYRQFYVNCALVNIIGPGGGVPKGFAKFPGTYKEEDPGEDSDRRVQILVQSKSTNFCGTNRSPSTPESGVSEWDSTRAVEVVGVQAPWTRGLDGLKRSLNLGSDIVSGLA